MDDTSDDKVRALYACVKEKTCINSIWIAIEFTLSFSTSAEDVTVMVAEVTVTLTAWPTHVPPHVEFPDGAKVPRISQRCSTRPRQCCPAAYALNERAKAPVTASKVRDATVLEVAASFCHMQSVVNTPHSESGVGAKHWSCHDEKIFRLTYHHQAW